MESVTSCTPAELNMKAQLQEDPQEDAVKINGEINGSYDEEMEMGEDPEMVANCTSQVQSNGEVAEISRVPSHQNGVEDNMEVDGDLECDTSETGNSNSEFSGIIDNSEPKIDMESFDSENERSNSLDESLNHMMKDDNDSIELTKVVNKGSESQIENDINEENCISGDLSEIDENEKRMEMEVQEEIEQLPSPEVNDLPRELKESKRDSLEITIVSRQVPIDLAGLRKVNADDSCEALNMSISKSPEENRNEINKSKTDSEDDRELLKSPDKSQEDDSCVEITPEKSSKKKKLQPLNIAPRRSSRNLNKTKSYADKDVYIEELDRKSDDDVEEVVPTDPLADDGKKSPKKNTIVVSDTKRLVEIAAGSKQNRGGKKEPTLVIIDTNSILSGKGAIAVSQTTLPQMTITPTPPRNAFSMLPVNVPSGIYSQKHLKVNPPPVQPSLPPPQPKPVILPTLTDDMYVVEAPSFIVPYVYEKPPVTALKDYVIDMEKTIKEQKCKEEKEKQKRKKESTEKEPENQSQEEEKPKENSSETVNVKESSDQTEKEPVKVKSEEGESSEKAEMDIKSEAEKTEKPKEETEKPEKGSDKSDTETDDEIKESDEDRKRESDDVEILADRTKKKNDSYFDNPLGKFFMQIGVNLVQEFVQTDLLRNQKRKRDRDSKNCPPEVHMAITSLLRTLECSKENNEPFKLELKKCSLCSFKTESELVMAHHLETPHMRNYVYRCNFCTMEVRSPHDILFHMEAVHNVRGRLERAPAFHQCPNCPFEDNQKGKLSRHLLSCAKKYKPERNQEPPIDWEPPAKIPRVRGSRPTLSMPGAMYPLAPRGVHNPLSRMPGPPSAPHNMLTHRGRGRPPISINRYIGDVRTPHMSGSKVLSQFKPGSTMFRSGSNSQPPVLLPTPYHISNNQIFQNKMNPAGVTAKLLQQPSISITPLPRQASAPSSVGPIPGSSQQAQFTKPGRPPGTSKATFVICEICDGYIKDLEQLRNHMQWIHKVKIHPKMIYNRPPLNCQKCQFRFFTDQGLERHLLGSHGLVTSSMQENANKGKDGGRCPVCGRVYQWKLLNHVARDHNMALKPAHLSYKCTVCTATFGMYKQFENHVYSAHSVVAKRVMPDKKPSTPQPSTSGSSSESLLKPLKINDEITIIPQPARAKTKPVPPPQKTNTKV